MAGHLGDEAVEFAGKPDRGARIAAQLRLAFLCEMLMQTIEPGRRHRVDGVIDDRGLDQSPCLEHLAGVGRRRVRHEGAAVLLDADDSLMRELRSAVRTSVRLAP